MSVQSVNLKHRVGRLNPAVTDGIEVREVSRGLLLMNVFSGRNNVAVYLTDEEAKQLSKSLWSMSNVSG